MQKGKEGEEEGGSRGKEGDSSPLNSCHEEKLRAFYGPQSVTAWWGGSGKDITESYKLCKETHHLNIPLKDVL